MIEQTGEWYMGDWRGGERNGEGTMQYQSGNVYVGQWKDGKREGEGRMQWLDSNEVLLVVDRDSESSHSADDVAAVVLLAARV